MGSLLTFWAIYTSLACYLLAVVNLLTRPGGSRWYRALWTAGCLLLWAHAGFAFHFYHHWSHAAAVQATARETREILGWQFGAGIWFNYALLVAWSVDVTQLWLSREFMVQPWSPFSTVVHLYAFLILFNGTVVFEHGPIRWLSIAATTWLIWLLWNAKVALSN